MPTGPYRAGRDLLLRRPPRVGQAPGSPLGRPDETRSSRPPRRLAARLDATTLADPGPARVRQDVHRGPDDRARCCEPASGSGSPRRATRSSATCSGRCSRRRASPATSVPIQHGAEGPGRSTTRAVTHAQGRRQTSGRGSTTDGRTSPPARRGCGPRAKMPDAVDVLFVDEAGQISLANVVAMARATGSLVLLGDPQQLDQPLQGHASAGRGSIGPGPRPRWPGDDAAGPGALPRDARGGCIRTLCAFTSEVFYDGRLESEPHLVVQRLDCARRGARRRRAAPARGRHRRRATASRRSRPSGSRRSPEPLVDGGATLDRPSRRRAGRSGWDDVADRRAVQRPGRGDQAAAAARRRGSARSTSSRARRRRSASTR